MTSKVYIESTVWYQMVNYSDSGFKDRAQQLFDLLSEKEFSVFISNIVLEEISFNGKKYRKRLEELLKKYKPKIILQSQETDDIAMAYIENAYRGRPRSSVIVDAFHAAIATTANITYMASFNYRNLLNVKVTEHMNAVNLLAGYNRHLTILPPFMFLSLPSYDGEKGNIDKQVWDIKTDFGKKLEKMLEKPEKKRMQFHESVTNDAARKFGLDIFRFNQTEEHHLETL